MGFLVERPSRSGERLTARVVQHVRAQTMTRAILLILAMLIPQSAGWVIAGCRAAMGGCGEGGSCCTVGGCCGTGTSACCEEPEESCCDRAAETTASQAWLARCDPQCCLELCRGVPLVRLGDSGKIELRATGHRELTGVPAWPGLVRVRLRDEALREQVAWPEPPPDDAPDRRARLCIWTI